MLSGIAAKAILSTPAKNVQLPNILANKGPAAREKKQSLCVEICLAGLATLLGIQSVDPSASVVRVPVALQCIHHGYGSNQADPAP